MVDLSSVSTSSYKDLVVEGRDLEDLLFHYLDELLFLFATEYHIGRFLEVLRLEYTENQICVVETRDLRKHCETSTNNYTKTRKVGKPLYSLQVRVYGEKLGEKHEKGTEIKAITMHEIRIERDPPQIYVLVDI